MFKPGDVVRLKSTNMKMTVDRVTETAVNVIWFDREDNVNRYWFEYQELELT
jgi:uncharacterized protein YodC (DUF2158 family)